jgi:drug/metabolite transporter (DMT)-like permease
LYLAGPTGLATVGDFSQPIREIAFIVGLGLIPTVTGHSIMNYSMKHLRGQVVSLANLNQFIFAGIMAWILLGEKPIWNFYIACALVVAGAITALRGHKPKPDEIPPIMDD